MISHDTRAQMMYDAQKKSVWVTYLLWLFLWSVSMHRLYVHKRLTAFLQVALGVAGLGFSINAFPGASVNTMVIGWGLLGLWFLSFLVDMLRIPSWVRRYNMNLVNRIA